MSISKLAEIFRPAFLYNNKDEEFFVHDAFYNEIIKTNV